MNSNLFIIYELINEKFDDVLKKKVKVIMINIIIYDFINVFMLYKF